MGCLRLVYHGGGGFHPPPKISGPIAPRKVKFYIHVAFDLYFQNMSKKSSIILPEWPEFGLDFLA